MRSPEHPVVYLDHNATTPLAPEAREAILASLESADGNPSSLHAAGQRARAVVEQAREEIAAVAGAPADGVIFVSGGTEADNLALRGVMEAARAQRRGAHLLVSAVEHPAVLGTAAALAEQGFEAEVVPVDSCGRVDLEELQRRLRPSTSLVSIMLANHEVGTLQPVREIAALLQRRGVLLHVDAVQAAPHLPLAGAAAGAHLLSLSAHKMRGPKGIGALVVRDGVEVRPQLTGGAQQGRRRAGTESPALCAGFAAAVRRLRPGERSAIVRRLRDRLEEEICARVPGARVLARQADRLPNTSCVLFEGVRADLAVVALDREGIQVSFGAACASGMARPSHVLLAMGLSEEAARGAVRFSLGETTTGEEIDRAVSAVEHVIARLRQPHPAAPAPERRILRPC